MSVDAGTARGRARAGGRPRWAFWCCSSVSSWAGGFSGYIEDQEPKGVVIEMGMWMRGSVQEGRMFLCGWRPGMAGGAHDSVPLWSTTTTLWRASMITMVTTAMTLMAMSMAMTTWEAKRGAMEGNIANNDNSKGPSLSKALQLAGRRRRCRHREQSINDRRAKFMSLTRRHPCAISRTCGRLTIPDGGWWACPGPPTSTRRTRPDTG